MFSSTITLSYFTDTDVKTSDFVVGNASTKLTIYGDESGETELDTSSYIITDGDKIPFYLLAKNDGNIPVFQRFRVVIPNDLSGAVTLNLPTENCTIDTSSESTCDNEKYTVIYKPSVEVDDQTYAEYYIVSNEVLAKDSETAKWPVMGIKFNEVSGIDKSSLFICEGESNNNCKLRISAYSDAIQTSGFTDGAVDAFVNFRETY